MNLTQAELDNRNYNFSRWRGRQAVVRNPYWTKCENGSRIFIHSYNPHENFFTILDEKGNKFPILPDELNLTDKEFSGFKIVKKGIRNERKDKFGNNFIILLQKNERDILFSESLISLLSSNGELKYVGFANDPDTKATYIFNADEVNGYELNKKNNRVTSKADWRELSLEGTETFRIIPQPIIDENNPGFVFYNIMPIFDEYNRSLYGNTVEEEKLGTGVQVTKIAAQKPNRRKNHADLKTGIMNEMLEFYHYDSAPNIKFIHSKPLSESGDSKTEVSTLLSQPQKVSGVDPVNTNVKKIDELKQEFE